MKYKVGDKVRVRTDLNFNVHYHNEDHTDWMFFTEGMKEFAGKSGHIVTISGLRLNSYLVEGYRNPWWTDEMFEGLADEPAQQDPAPQEPSEDLFDSLF